MTVVGSIEWSPARRRIEAKAADAVRQRQKVVETDAIVKELKDRNQDLQVRLGQAAADLHAAKSEAGALAAQLKKSDNHSTAWTLLYKVAEEHNLSVELLTSANRTKEIARARQEFYYRAACETNLSLGAIGAMLGGLDHTTIHYGILAHAKRHSLTLPRGMKHPAPKKARLPDITADTIRGKLRSGCDTVSIAKQFGIEEHQVWNILARGDGEATP